MDKKKTFHKQKYKERKTQLNTDRQKENREKDMEQWNNRVRQKERHR